MSNYLRLGGTIALLATAACARHEPGRPAALGNRVAGARAGLHHASGFSVDIPSGRAEDYSADTVALPLEVCVEQHGAVRCLGEARPPGACNAGHAERRSGEGSHLSLGSRSGEGRTGTIAAP